MRTLMSRLVAGLLALTIIGGCVGCATGPDISPGSISQATVPTGQAGAAWFDQGYLVIGSGPKIVDIYLDPLCPFCKKFEHLSGPFLLDEASAGKATLRIHPVALLDRLSAGTQYSTRAAAALTSIAATDPGHLAAYLQVLYDNQPAENTPGLTDTQLVDLARTIGTHLSPTDTLVTYQAWVRACTERARTGPLTNTHDLTNLTVVPTVLVNGYHYPGNSDEITNFHNFYTTH